MELLSYQQFACKFPVPELPSSENDRAWALILQKFRNEGKLIERTHWKYQKGPANFPARFYNPRVVVKVIIREARGKSPRPTISILYQQHLEEFIKFLEDTASANDASSASPAVSQDKTSTP